MPAKGRVSIPWQIVFTVISPINIWAFYRIKKLRRYVLYVIIPSALIVLTLSLIGYYEMTLIDPFGGQMSSDIVMPTPPYMTPIKPQVVKFDTIPYNVIGITSSVALTIFSIYLMIKWVRD